MAPTECLPSACLLAYLLACLLVPEPPWTLYNASATHLQCAFEESAGHTDTQDPLF